MTGRFAPNFAARSPLRAALLLSLLFPVLLLAGLMSLASHAAEDAPESQPPVDVVAAALFEVSQTNLVAAEDWLGSGDFKSLSDTIASLDMLAQMLAACGDAPSWRTPAKQTLTQLAKLRTATSSRDAAACRSALDAYTAALKAWSAAAPAGKPLPRVTRPASMKHLMLLCDATYADARQALREDDVKNAKTNAYVLAELGGIVSTYREDAPWAERSQGMTDDARLVAQSDSTDPVVLTGMLRKVYRHCEACHGRRPR